MAGTKVSLLSFLKQPDPKICSKNSFGGNNTTSKGRRWSKPDVIQKWEDFEYERVTGLFRGLLEIEVKNNDLPNFSDFLPFHLKEIYDEDSLTALLLRWTNATVSTALAVAQRGGYQIGSDAATDPDEIFMARGGRGWIPHKPKRRLLRPDWAGIQASQLKEVKVNHQERTMYRNLLPGDSKLSSKWSSKDYEEHPKERKYVDPLRQIFTYCLSANAQYEYLITQEELIVVHVSYRSDCEPQFSQTRKTSKPSAPSGSKKRKAARPKKILEYQSVAWETEDFKDSKTFTVNLALWCLHMMARDDGALNQPGQNVPSNHSGSDSQSDISTDIAGTEHGRKKRQRC